MSGNKLKSAVKVGVCLVVVGLLAEEAGFPVADTIQSIKTSGTPANLPVDTGTSGTQNQPRKLEVSVADRYAHYGKKVGMAAVLADGIATPAPDAACRKSWKSRPKSAAINWDNVTYNCMPKKLRGKGWTPQGMGGSATTEHYAINGQLASERSLRLVGQYSIKNETGLAFPVKKGQNASRLVLFDDEANTHQTIELVKPAANGKGKKPALEGLQSHMGGVGWGDYIYVTSGYTISMFNPDDVIESDKGYIMPQAAEWQITPRTKSMGRVASGASINRSQGRDQLVTVGYGSGKGYIYRWDLGEDGLPMTRPSKDKSRVDMVSDQIQKGKIITNATTEDFYAATHLQGVSSAGNKTYATSSHTKVSNSNDADVLFVKTGNDDPRGYRMPGPNIEASYYDYQTDELVVNNEHGSQFMYKIPLAELPN